MAELSRQDIQAIALQNANLIMAKSASRQDIIDAVQNLSSKMCTKQDALLILDRLKEENANHIHLHDQRDALKQIVLNQDVLFRRMDRIEARLADVQTVLYELATKGTIVHRQPVGEQISLNGETT